MEQKPVSIHRVCLPTNLYGKTSRNIKKHPTQSQATLSLSPPLPPVSSSLSLYLPILLYSASTSSMISTVSIPGTWAQSHPWYPRKLDLSGHQVTDRVHLGNAFHAQQESYPCGHSEAHLHTSTLPRMSMRAP